MGINKSKGDGVIAHHNLRTYHVLKKIIYYCTIPLELELRQIITLGFGGLKLPGLKLILSKDVYLVKSWTVLQAAQTYANYV